jgi:hypothetical protein
MNDITMQRRLSILGLKKTYNEKLLCYEISSSDYPKYKWLRFDTIAEVIAYLYGVYDGNHLKTDVIDYGNW